MTIKIKKKNCGETNKKLSRILVTGALGFMGSYLCKELLNIGERVIGLNRNSSSKNYLRIDSIKHNPNFNMIYADFSKTNMTEYLDDIDIIYHCGAKSFVNFSIIDPEPFIENNIIGTYNMLEALRKSNVKKYIQISTDEVYGSCSGEPFTEESPLKPGNPYSSSKASADMLAISYHNTYGLPIIISRSENIYGPYQGKEKVIPHFVKLCLEGKSMTLYGDGSNTRRWLHLRDQCSALYLLSQKGNNGEIYNVASEEEISNLELSKKIAKVLKVPEKIIFIEDRLGHDKRYAIDVSKLKSLGWKPKYTLDTVFEDVINWYKKNQWWLN